MASNNNYLKVLNYLKEFEGDGEFHEIENIFGDVEGSVKSNIFNELYAEDFIKLIGGHPVIPTITIGKVERDGYGGRRYESKTFGGLQTGYITFKAKLTFKGSKYLKEQLEENLKYNITIGNYSNANLILNSPYSNISYKTDIVDRAKEIIKIINSDESLESDIKYDAIDVFNELINETHLGQPTNNTINRILTIGASIASIGSLVISLIQLLQTK